MTSILPRPSGAHRADDVIAERDQRIEQLAADNEALVGANEDLVCALASAVVRGCQDSMRIAQVEAELSAAVGEVKRLQQKTIRDAANLQRLRQAVINARPRITYTVQALDRPYIARIETPYRLPHQSAV